MGAAQGGRTAAPWRQACASTPLSQSAANNLSKQFGERKKKGESLDDLQVEIAKVKEEIAKAEAKKDASEVCCAASRLSFASLLLSLTRRQCG